MHGQPFHLMLQGGDRRSIGNANRAAAVVLKQPDRMAELIECLESQDAVVRMRAADAAEKVSAKRPGLLAPFAAELLALARQTTQQELRWHLALMIPRLRLGREERLRAADVFWPYLEDRSSIVKTFALQALFDLSRGMPEMQPDLLDVLERTLRSGTPAMKARSRKLLAGFRKRQENADTA